MLLFIGLVIMYLQCYFELFRAVHIPVLSIRVSKNEWLLTRGGRLREVPSLVI